uniref:Phenoloxidase-activating factor 2 n=3 Tax=Manduca sexta TaxID=7130 RepID=Q56SF4_MANSE|nr:serine proteinase-like protein 4 [Manduca sexta]
MYKTFPFLMLLVCACAQTINVDEIARIFGFPFTSKPQSNATELSCSLDAGQTGECVLHYQCNKITNTIINDGTDIIDIRTYGPCPTIFEICCALPDKRPEVTPKPELKRQGCGWRNPEGVVVRTTGDTDGETKFGEFPWMVAILKLEPLHDPNGLQLEVYVGGGSLIHPSVVLTTAHYVASRLQLRARAGEWDTQHTKEPYPHQDRDVSRIVVHKDFNKGNLFYDVALLFLNSPMDLAPNVGLACLPKARERATAGTRCFASGWGKDKFGKDGRYQVILKKIEVPVVDRNTCRNQLRKTRLGRYFELHSSFMCAGGEPGRDTCKGDGGSPLVCPSEYEKDRYVQNGIVAWGIGCGEDGTPGVYVDVANVREWIDGILLGVNYDVSVYEL